MPSGRLCIVAWKLIPHTGLDLHFWCVSESQISHITLLNLRQRRCLRIFLIGVGDHEKLSLRDLFSPYIIPSLHPDLRQHIENELGEKIEEDDAGQSSEDQDLADAAFVHARSHQDTSHAEREVITISVTNFGDGDADANANTDADGIPDDEADVGCSGFGLDGSVPKWNKQKFWNYVDATLEAVRENARRESNSQSGYEEVYRKYVTYTPI